MGAGRAGAAVNPSDLLAVLKSSKYTGAILLHFAEGTPKVAEKVVSERIVLDSAESKSDTVSTRA